MLPLTRLVTLQIFMLVVLVSQTWSFEEKPDVRLELLKICLAGNGVLTEALVPRNELNSSRYTKLNALQWNTRIPTIYPLAYFLPKSTFEVQVAVRCGSKFRIQLIPKSGGHSYELYGYGNSDTIVVDLQKMNGIRVNSGEGTAEVGAGALIGEIFAKVWHQGGFGVSLPPGMNVGIGGAALGGGYGLYSNLYGLTSDNVLELHMVDAKGFAHKVTTASHSDLLWAQRGVGSGYIGIVTKFKFKMFQASTLKQTFVSLDYEFDANCCLRELLESWHNWMIWARQNEPTVYSALNVSESRVNFFALHVQDSTAQTRDSTNCIKAIKKIFPPSKTTNVSVVPYWKFLQETGTTQFYSMDSQHLENGLDLGNVRSYSYAPYYFHSHDFYVDSDFSMSSNSLDKIAKLLGGQLNAKNASGVRFMAEGVGGSKLPPSATSFVHRNSLYRINLRLYESRENLGTHAKLALLNKLLAELKFMDNGESYQNNVDADLQGDYLKRYYGANLKRLIKIKSKWDRENYFTNPQSIPTSAAEQL